MSTLTRGKVEEEIQKLEDDYNKQILEVAIYKNNEKNGNMTNTYQNIKVDSFELYNEANDIIERNAHLSNKDIAIKLLYKIATKGKSKYISKLAAEMLREEWWNK